MIGDNAVGNGQSQASTFFFGADKGIKKKFYLAGPSKCLSRHQ